MNPKHKRTLTRMFWGLVGIFALYIVYGWIVEQTTLSKYQKVFVKTQHPQATSLIDSLSFKFQYYPATFVDESIHFRSAYLVGELRQYSGNWDDVKSFYDKRNPLEDGAILMALPLEVHQRQERISLAFRDGYSLSPFDADVLAVIQEQYGSRGIPRNLNGTEQNLYLIYGSWVDSD